MDKKTALIVGASGHGKVIADIIEKQGIHTIVGFVDDTKPAGEKILDYQVIGKTEDMKSLVANGKFEIFIAVGDNWQRAMVHEKIKYMLPEAKFGYAIHPSAQVGKDVKISQGTVIMAGAVINPGCTIGKFCILNTRSSIDHDSKMNDYSSLAPGVVTGGNIEIGNFTAISIGAILKHQVHIGDHCVIGAGAVVLNNIEDYFVAFGNPAKKIKQREKGEKYL